jgi:hypothetical protein
MDVAPGSVGTGARNVRFGCGASEPHQRRLGMRSGALSPRIIGRNASASRRTGWRDHARRCGR